MKLFLDVDGVLVDGYHANPERRRRWDTTLHDDLGIDPEALQKAFFEPYIERVVAGELDLKATLADVLPTLGYTGSVDAFLQYWFDKDSKLNPEMWEAVQTLARRDDLDLYLATGQEHRRATYLWETLGLGAYFDDIFYSAQIGQHKSSPRFFAAINAELGIGSHESPLFFDDSPAVVAAARAAGWDAHEFETPRDFLEHCVIQTWLQNAPKSG